MILQVIMPKAIRIVEYTEKFADGARVDVVIWRLPETTPERPHRFKCRLNYCNAEGVAVVRYDNEKGKGDHKHITGRQLPYKFNSIRQLFIDFRTDILEQGGVL